jgi:hypothetical protein
MRRKLNRLPIPLMLALAVAVGVAVTIIIQVSVFPPVPAVVAPIETTATSLDSGTSTYTISIDAVSGDYVIYPTLAGLGKLQLTAGKAGWYYLANDWIPTLVRRSASDDELTLGSGSKLYVKEINSTHAFILYQRYTIGIVANKVQVGTTGWIVYHPVATAYDSTTKNIITNLMNSLSYGYIYVFQPKPGYVTFDSNTKVFQVYLDTFYSDGTVNEKSYYMTNITNFEPLPPSTAVTVNGIERLSMYNFVLYPVWVLLYDMPTSNEDYPITIAPTR